MAWRGAERPGPETVAVSATLSKPAESADFSRPQTAQKLRSFPCGVGSPEAGHLCETQTFQKLNGFRGGVASRKALETSGFPDRKIARDGRFFPTANCYKIAIFPGSGDGQARCMLSLAGRDDRGLGWRRPAASPAAPPGAGHRPPLAARGPGAGAAAWRLRERAHPHGRHHRRCLPRHAAIAAAGSDPSRPRQPDRPRWHRRARASFPRERRASLQPGVGLRKRLGRAAGRRWSSRAARWATPPLLRLAVFTH